MNDIEKDIRRVVWRVKDEIETIETDGVMRGDCWYALDRIKMIAEVCKRAVSGEELACVFGLGTEDEEQVKKIDKILCL